ncbi:ABC transporter permease [Pseudorhodobacter sp. W20_MBD10_FR17]|uniref:ABC transporter permease n=1 Tax=Pseudorhodobacter sp. W20_MBD10_FR17 TaxID=3240266 RepID=UPI003F9A722D
MIDAAADTLVESPQPENKSKPLGTAGYIGVAILGFWFIIFVLGAFIAPYDATEFVSDDGFLAPSTTFLLGTDYLGRDLLSRLLVGTQLTLIMAICATVIASGLGTVLGVLAAVAGRSVDMILSRINDAFLSFPTTILGLVIIAALGASIPVLVVTTGFIYASSVFRVSRALAMDQVQLDYVVVARARGEGHVWIALQEILPNIYGPLLVDFGMRLAFAILFLSALSFLGLGVQPPLADWGTLVRENMTGLTSGVLTPIFPAIAIASFAVGLNLIVDDLATRSGQDIAGKLI